MIFALTRTGSTTLMRILNLQKCLRCAHEPFNPDVRYYRLDSQVNTEDELSRAMETIYEDYDGIKHTWNFRGWPFMWMPQLNKLILLKAGKIVFLTRKNILQRIVSSEISMQTKIWHLPDLSEKSQISKFEFKPLNAERIKWLLMNENIFLTEWRTYIKENKLDYMELSYEDIYSDRLNSAEKCSTLDNLFSFLGYPGIETLPYDQLENLLAIDNKMSPAEIYRQIPEIEKIDREFGSDETGWLFH
ncbi:hypothetical protein GCM10011511_16070 [Puia dinghuensis]|uniref:Sulphotransferase Stf0 domain-containing protein n=2 Tax=Puia dinghuensis TaxID=1792502 RepID=A0A8J2UBQ0_9BACT|nr:hypothetical protein GCM10011511_16070 [Puia dinghuensis]